MSSNKDSYRDNPLLKRAGVEHAYTQEQVEEYMRCAEDPVYFAANYIKIVNVDRGLIPFEMWDFQKDMIRTYHENRFSITKCPRQVGKALDIETPILTIQGFKPLKELVVGDVIFGPDGKTTKITFITDVMHDRPCYLVTFSNRDTIVADAEHLWTVNSGNWNNEKTLTTEELIPYLSHSNRPYVEFTKPVEFTEQRLPIDPYLLGVWLGDGASGDGRITTHKDDLTIYQSKFEIGHTYTDTRNSNVVIFRVNNLYPDLRKNNLLNNKHIPEMYKMGSIKQRLELVRGLMDTDGSVRKHNGGCEFYQKDEKLIDDFRYLLSSLGIKSTKNHKFVNGIRYYCVNFTTTESVFHLPRKKTLQKCKDHPKNGKLYFESIERVESRPVRCLQVDNESHLFLAGTTLIPTHNTTTSVAYLLWLTLFSPDQNIAVLANKGSLARDILAKYQLAYENLPMWLQQGVVVWNKGNVELENGSKIIAASTSSSAIRGGAFNVVFLDEFAFVPNNIADEFFNSVYPVISSGKTTKIIIVSTPNGMNLFYKLWMDAIAKKNNYKTFEIHWSMVPGRDEHWKEETIRNTSLDQFRQEFECEFMGSTNTLISGSKLAQLVHKDPLVIYDMLNIFEYPIKGDEESSLDHIYAITVDPAEGRNLDASAFSIFDISQIPYKQVARYSSSSISPVLFPTVIYNAAKLYNNAFVLVEINNTPQIADTLHADLEYENLVKIETGNKKAQAMGGGFGRGIQLGIKMSPQVKRIGCSNLKTLIENDKLIINDFTTISELSSFVASSNSFKAEEGASDDIVMTLVLFAWMTTQQYFKELVNHDLRKQMQLEMMNQADSEMLSFGLYDDGTNENYVVEGGDVWLANEKDEVGSFYGF